MVSQRNILILGAAAVALAVGGFGLSKTKTGGKLIQNVFGAKDPMIPEEAAPIISAEKQSFLSDIGRRISNLQNELFPKTPFVAPRNSQKKVFFAPPKRLTDSQILGQRRLIAKSQARGIGRLTNITFQRAAQLTTFEQRRVDVFNRGQRDQKIELLGQLKVLRDDALSV